MSDISVRVHAATQATAFTSAIVELYAAVFAEPPYHEDAEDVEGFRELLEVEIPQPGFRLVTAEIGTTLVGFGYGYTLRASTRWWEGIAPPLPPALTAEWDGRTFAIKEIAVAAPHRRKGIARLLHDSLLDHRHEERATLTVRPEAYPAIAAYASWGWSETGRIQPTSNGIEYLVMVRPLH